MADSTSTVPDDWLTTLEERFPGRQRELGQLHNLLGKPGSPLPPAIFVSGHSATGKTTVVRAFLEHLPRRRWAYVNCVDRFAPRLLFEDALNQFAGMRPTFRNGVCRNYARCDTEADFVLKLRELLEGAGHCLAFDDDRHILVVDRAERLRDMSASLLPSLLRLGELTERNICVVLISSVIWEKFRTRTGSLEPIKVRFRDYNKHILANVLQIIAKDRPVGEPDASFFLTFVDTVYEVFQKNCKDLNELRHLVAMLFPVYAKPVHEGYVKRTETSKLFKLAQPHFATASDKLYLRDISSAE
ncbi:AAA ATPase domain-containing protein, partial [Thamnocephalis sphaerospora]